MERIKCQLDSHLTRDYFDHPSVSTMRVRVAYRSIAQVQYLVRWLVDRGYEFEYEIEGQESGNPTHFVTIQEIDWGRNIRRLGILLESLDPPEAFDDEDNSYSLDAIHAS